jgi:hypothetical protein
LKVLASGAEPPVILLLPPWPFSIEIPASLCTAGIRRPQEGDDMGRNGWIAGLALWAGLTAGTPVAAQTPDRFTIQVLLCDDAGVPAEALERAKRDAALIYERSNITLQWIEEPSLLSRTLILRIIFKPLGEKSRNRAVVGIAPGSREARGRLAFVFYERIQGFSEALELDVALMLGHVMAHELGHLLLPYDSHSLSGVMRGAWDRAQARDATGGNLTFNPDQARLIRERLAAPASPTARAR